MTDLALAQIIISLSNTVIDPSSVTISLPIPGKANKLVRKANKNKLVLISLN